MSDLVTLNVNAVVRDRYSEASQTQVPELCCPVSYDPQFLKVIPQEVLDRDYGCGDPSKYLRKGDIVLDLGSGGGKICFIAAQVVGATGRVIGVDCNEDMLALARRARIDVTQRVGFDNVEFRKGRIQDLKLDLDRLESRLREHPVGTSSDWLHAQEMVEELQRTTPMVIDESIDVVVSNCVLNLVKPHDRHQLFAEIFRVLKPGGRAVISDIVASRHVPMELQNNAELWSGCISGAFTEEGFLQAFEQAGFGGIEILERQSAPWRVVEGIEFRSMTLRAHKLPLNCCSTWNGADAIDVVYRGPWKSVTDDNGQVFQRGSRSTVCPSTAEALNLAPYSGQMLFISQPGSTGMTLPLAAEPSCCGPTGCC